MADITQVDYDVLASLEKDWTRFADSGDEYIPKMRAHMEALHGGGWQGQAADKFLEEFEGEVLPALERYVKAIREAANTMTKIRQTFSEAEEESKGYFSGLE